MPRTLAKTREPIILIPKRPGRLMTNSLAVVSGLHWEALNSTGMRSDADPPEER